MNKNTRQLVITALFIALILLLGMTPLGIIPLPFIKLTILCIPVVVGTLILGLKTGMILGFCFGLASMLSAFGLSPLNPPSALAGALAGQNLLYAILLCFVPRLAVPAVTYGVYRLIARNNAHSKRALPFAAIAGSLCNTIIYLGLMLFFYVITGLDTAGVLGIIGGTGLLGGSLEAVAAAVICPPIVMALWKTQQNA